MANDLMGGAATQEDLYEYLRKKYEHDYDRATESRDRQTLNANLGQAAHTIANAIGGVKNDASFYDNLRKQAEQGVQDIEAQRKSTLEDYLRRQNEARANQQQANWQKTFDANQQKDARDEKYRQDTLGLQKQSLQLKDYLAKAKGASGPGAAPLTPGQTAVDKAFAKEYSDYVAGGGYADTVKQLDQLKEAKNRLSKTDTASGPVVSLLPDFARERLFPEGAAIKDAIEEVVQRNLRLVLGAQFTQKEGDRLIARAYNPRLSEQENMARLDRLVSQIEKAAAAKQEAIKYYEANGTLQGFQGRLPSLADIGAGLDEPTPSVAAPTAAPKKFYSPSRNQTKIVYPDGREEIVDGKQ